MTTNFSRILWSSSPSTGEFSKNSRFLRPYIPWLQSKTMLSHFKFYKGSEDELFS
jgi:hypothetical protein